MPLLILLARQFLFVRETLGPNHGVWVGLFQQYTNNRSGDSWCCSFISFLLSIAYEGASPLTKTASCATMLAEARKKGYEVKTPAVGDLYFFLDATGHAHHIGIITDLTPMNGIAGNTSEDGMSSNGTGVFEHEIGTGTAGRRAYVRLPAP